MQPTSSYLLLLNYWHCFGWSPPHLRLCYYRSTHTVVKGIPLTQKFKEALCLRPFPTPHSPATEKRRAHTLGLAKPSKTWCWLAFLVPSSTDTRARFFNDSKSLPLTSALPRRLSPLGEFHFQPLKTPLCESNAVRPRGHSFPCLRPLCGTSLPQPLCHSPGLSCSSVLRRAT